MAKANMKELEALHSLLAQYYTEMLDSGEELSSGTLAALNTFLKNNDIKVDVVDSSPMQDLSANISKLVEVQH